MASTIRLTASAPVSCAGTGAFGRRVAGLLTAALPAAREYPGPAAAFGQGSGAVVVAMWRPSPAVAEQADELSFAHRRPWLPVIMEHPVLRVGPWVGPPGSPCFACYQARRDQHDEQRATTALLHEAYDDDPDLGPAGFLPQHARVAAGIALAMLAAAGRGAVLAGRVVTVRLGSASMSADHVAARHGCQRCSPDVPHRDLRSLASSTRPGGHPPNPQCLDP